MMLTTKLNQILKQVFEPRRIIKYLAYAVIPASLFYIIALKWMMSSGFSIMDILRDPAQTRETSSMLGFLSNIGIWVWVSSVAIGMFTVLLLPRRTGGRMLLFQTSLLSLLLAVDDFFMIHDRYVDQNICYLTYAVILLSIFFFQFKTLVASDILPFLTAGSFLALSIASDLLQQVSPLGYTYSQVMEEGFKFLGATSWLYFTGALSAQLLKKQA